MTSTELTLSRAAVLANIVGDITGTTPSTLTTKEAELWASCATALGAAGITAASSSPDQILAAIDAAVGGTLTRLTSAEAVLLADSVTKAGTATTAAAVTRRAMLARLADLDLVSSPTADYDLDFTTGSLPAGVTFARASKGWYFDASGVLQEAATDAARFDHNPSGLAARGLLMEEARTNALRNSRLEGAVANGSNLLTNGDFALNPINASVNTVQNGWRWSRAGGTATPTYSGGVVTLSPDGTNALRLSQQLPTQPSSSTIATIYTVSLDVGSNTVDVTIGNVVNGSNFVNRTGQGPGTVTFTFSTTGGTIWLNIVRTATGGATIDNVSVSVLSRFPTNWTSSSNTGLTGQVVGAGTEDGIPYTDIRLAGTTAVGGTNHNYFPEANTQMAASSGQTWTFSVYLRLVGGTTTGLNFMNVSVGEMNSGGTQLAVPNSFAQQITSAALTTQRYVVTATLGQATTAFVRALIQFNTNASTAIDCTIRVGIPQCEIGDTVSSPILAPAGSPAATTRAADVATKTLAAMTLSTIAFDGEVRVASAASIRYGTMLISDDSNDFLEVYVQSGKAFADAESNVSGNFDYNDIDTGAISAETRFKVAVAQRQTVMAASRDGGAVQSLAQPVSLPMGTLGIGCSVTGTSQLRGWVRRIRVWSRGLLDHQLRGVST